MSWWWGSAASQISAQLLSPVSALGWPHSFQRAETAPLPRLKGLYSAPSHPHIPASALRPEGEPGGAWLQLRLGLRKRGQMWLLVAEWADAGVALLLHVCRRWWWGVRVDSRIEPCRGKNNSQGEAGLGGRSNTAKVEFLSMPVGSPTLRSHCVPRVTGKLVCQWPTSKPTHPNLTSLSFLL